MMQQRKELDWIGHVLRDVVTFLTKNDMMDSAKMLAIAAAQIEHDMKMDRRPQQSAVEIPANVVIFSRQKRPLH